jgi:hypothetical protein
MEGRLALRLQTRPLHGEHSLLAHADPGGEAMTADGYRVNAIMREIGVFAIMREIRVSRTAVWRWHVPKLS